MGEVTLTVPGEYVEFFKLGVLQEIQTDCGHLVDNAQELAASPQKRGWGTDEDVQATGRLLASDLAVLAQLPEEPGEEAVTIVAPSDGCLEHAAAATARSVIGPRLTGELAHAPMAEGESPEILALAAALHWAVTTAGEQLGKRVAGAEATPKAEVV